MTSKTASPYSPARRRGAVAASRPEHTAAGVGAGGAPGAGGRNASAKAGATDGGKSKPTAKKAGTRQTRAGDYQNADRRPSAPAGITPNSRYQGGGTQSAGV